MTTVILFITITTNYQHTQGVVYLSSILLLGSNGKYLVQFKQLASSERFAKKCLDIEQVFLVSEVISSRR